MTYRRQHQWIIMSVLMMTLFVAQDVWAQRGRGMFGANRVQLASLEKVQTELKLTDEQKKLAQELSDKFVEDRREVFQANSGGDFAAMREQVTKLGDEATATLTAKLDEGQQKRLTELYVQVNGTNALFDQVVSAGLKISDEQKPKLAEARQANFDAMRAAFQDTQNMSDDERREAFAKLRSEGDTRLLAVLNDQQKSDFEKMKGVELELDLSSLMRRPGGN